MSAQKGYTIVELLIFIAVSALIFIAAIAAIGGRQEQVQYSQATTEFEAKIRDIVNDVSTGYFPTNESITCQVLAGTVTISSAANDGIGTNDECVYVGKVVQFQPDINNNNVVDGDEKAIIRVYTLAGRRYEDTKLTPSSTIAAAKAQAVAKPGDPAFVGSVEQYTLLYGLTVDNVIRPISSSLNSEYGTIGLVSNFGGLNVSNAQAVQVGGIFGTSLGQNEANAVATINQLTDDVSMVGSNGFIEKSTAEGVVVCLLGPSGQKASLTIGASSSSGTRLDIDTYNRNCDL